MSRISKPIETSSEIIQELRIMGRSLKMERRYVTRSQVILLSLEGKTITEIIASTGLSRPNVNKWRQRFRSRGLEGLKDSFRSGKPSTITAVQKACVIQKACEKPSGGYTNWSQRRIAKEVGISQSKVHQILRQADLKPHRIDYWCGKIPNSNPR